MSYNASAWAATQITGSAQRKAVLMYLADKADDEWSCYPGQARIALVTELGERTVRRALADLEAAGFIKREQRRRPDGYRTSDRYWLRPSSPRPAAAAGEPPEPDPSPANDADLTGQSGPTSPAAAAGYPSVVTTSETTSTPTPSATAAPTADALFEVPTVVDDLCTELADAIAKHRDGSHGGRPTITAAWRRDMRLLLERGPLGSEAAPLEPRNVQGCIRVVFTQLADPDGKGFCWAAQVQSPAAMRRHWWRLRDAAKALRVRTAEGRLAGLSRVLNDGEQAEPVENLFARAEAGRAARLGLPAPTPAARVPAVGAGR